MMNACSSINSKEVTKTDSKISSTQSVNSIESEINIVPVDIWERIRLELSISIPEDQIAATSLYRERLYKNQSAVNRISKSGQRYLYHTLTRAL